MSYGVHKVATQLFQSDTHARTHACLDDRGQNDYRAMYLFPYTALCDYLEFAHQFWKFTIKFHLLPGQNMERVNMVYAFGISLFTEHKVVGTCIEITSF